MSVKSFLLCSLCTLSLCSFVCPASVIGAGHTGGYSQVVKSSVLPHWTAPKRSLSHPIRILLEISAQGDLKNCLVIISSGSDAVDKSVCTAAKQASPFTAPPSRAEVDVFLSFGGESSAKKEPAENIDSGDITQSTTPKSASSLSPKPTVSPVVAPVAKTSPSPTVPPSPLPSSPPVKKETHSMTHAGIDYSKPKPTPLGVQPLATGLVGVTLPPAAGDTPSVSAPSTPVPSPTTASTLPVPSAPVEKSAPKAFIPPEIQAPKVEVHQVEKRSEQDLPAKTEPKVDDEVVEKARPYAEGKTPFIQNNRRGQVMDENDFYINQILARVRKIVQFPLGMKPGVVSASVNMHISASGVVIGADLSRSSRNKALDEALVDATKKVTRLPRHPSGIAQTLYLIFMVETPH